MDNKVQEKKQGMYVFKPTYTTSKSNVVTTVEENMVGFISRQIERAKLSMKIYTNVGLPAVNNSKHILSTNMILNCLISVADKINTENIYGTSMASFKGKSTSSKPRPLIKDDIQILSKI